MNLAQRLDRFYHGEHGDDEGHKITGVEFVTARDYSRSRIEQDNHSGNGGQGIVDG